MTWETIIGGALTGISNFVYTLISIIGGSMSAQSIEGFVAIFAIAVICRIFQGGVKIPEVKLPKLKKKDEDEEEEWEYVMIRRRKDR